MQSFTEKVFLSIYLFIYLFLGAAKHINVLPDGKRMIISFVLRSVSKRPSGICPNFSGLYPKDNLFKWDLEKKCSLNDKCYSKPVQ